MPLTRGDARFIRLPVFSRKFLLTRTMFSGLHLSLSLTVVNVSYRNYFNDRSFCRSLVSQKRVQSYCFISNLQNFYKKFSADFLPILLNSLIYNK